MESETEDPCPWEALDLDDSNLSSFLRPCKRKSLISSPPNPKKTFSLITSLQPCSLLSQQTQTQNPLAETPPPHSDSPPSIPGPAGAVQSAMFRKRQNLGNPLLTGEQPVPTQEYIRRAVEEPGGEDEDFSRDPWLFAVDFVRRQGLADVDGTIGTPLSSVKNWVHKYKMDQIVAIVKSCTPNGLGDLIVTLKDPTDTIDASIHRRVLAGKYGNDISVGAVLILQKVAVFTPSPSVRYLNITLSNVVKVFSKDKGSQSRQIASPVQFADHSIEKSKQGTQCGSDNFSQAANTRETVHACKKMAMDGIMGSNINRSDNVGKAPSLERQNLANIMGKVALGRRGNVRSQMAAVDKDSSAENEVGKGNRGGSTESSSRNAASNIVGIVDKQEDGNMQGKERQRQQQTSKSALPVWTDEQLDELFALE